MLKNDYWRHLPSSSFKLLYIAKFYAPRKPMAAFQQNITTVFQSTCFDNFRKKKHNVKSTFIGLLLIAISGKLKQGSKKLSWSLIRWCLNFCHFITYSPWNYIRIFKLFTTTISVGLNRMQHSQILWCKRGESKYDNGECTSGCSVSRQFEKNKQRNGKCLVL